MPEANQYLVPPRELAEMIVKSAGIREGRWYLIANFGFAPGNFGPTPAQLAPGVAVIVQNMGIQRVVPEAQIPAEIIVDASKMEFAAATQKVAFDKSRKVPKGV